MTMIAGDPRIESAPLSQVSWAAIAAGAVTAAAMGFVLMAFGAGIGLSVVSPYEGEGWGPAAFATAAGLWVLWVHVLGFYLGGYVTGRLRSRPSAASDHEADVGDTLHGVVTWGAGAVLAAVIALAGLGGAASSSNASAGNPVASSVSSAVSGEVAEGAAREAAKGPPEAQVSSAAERRAEVVRKLTVISAFITAASMLAGLAAAVFGAVSGGHHRDARVELTPFAHRRATTTVASDALSRK